MIFAVHKMGTVFEPSRRLIYLSYFLIYSVFRGTPASCKLHVCVQLLQMWLNIEQIEQYAGKVIQVWATVDGPYQLWKLLL